jgi:hypothetical protein
LGRGLLYLVPQNRGLLKILLLNSLGEALLELPETVRKISRVPQRLGNFADVAGPLVHGFQQTLECVSKCAIAIRAPQTSGFLEICLRETATWTTDIRPSAGLLDFL